jgi:hypothetical protein
MASITYMLVPTSARVLVVAGGRVAVIARRGMAMAPGAGMLVVALGTHLMNYISRAFAVVGIFLNIGIRRLTRPAIKPRYFMEVIAGGRVLVGAIARMAMVARIGMGMVAGGGMLVVCYGVMGMGASCRVSMA